MPSAVLVGVAESPAFNRSVRARGAHCGCAETLPVHRLGKPRRKPLPVQIKLIFEASVGLHQATVQSEDELVIDSTVQEANITYPTETKLRERIIKRLWTLGAQSGVYWECSYKHTVPRLRRLPQA